MHTHHPCYYLRNSHRVAGSLLAALLLFLVTPVAQAAKKIFDIPAQPLTSAVAKFIEQSGVTVNSPGSYDSEAASAPITGDMEPSIALSRMLAGTPYEVNEYAKDQFMLIRKIDENSPGMIKGRLVLSNGRPLVDVRVGLVGGPTNARTNEKGEFYITNVAPGRHVVVANAKGYRELRLNDVLVQPDRMTTLQAVTVAEADPSAGDVPQIVRAESLLMLDPYRVNGKNIKPFIMGNMDIARTMEDVQPYYIFDARTIGLSGAIDVNEFLKSHLTMNMVGLSNSDRAGPNTAGNTSAINLRGLGQDQTLVLVNGRRIPGVADSPTESSQGDLNGIPLAAIERIEVLPASASGIYGASAMAGVVNVILKKNYLGGEVRVTYDNAWHDDSPRKVVDASYGFSLEGGRTRVMLSGSWSQTKAMLFQDRYDIYKQNFDLIQARAPQFFSSYSPFLGSLPNIASYVPLVLKSGEALGSTITYIPAGTSPSTPMATLSAQLKTNAGQWNYDLPQSTQTPTGLLRPLSNEPEVKSFRASIRRMMWPRLELFADFNYSTNATESVYNPANYVYVSSLSPANPFTSDVMVQMPSAETFPISTMSTNRSFLFGALLQLPGDWTASIDLTHSVSKSEYTYYHLDTGFGMYPDVLSGAFNPFVDTTMYPLNYAKYLSPTNYRGEAVMNDISLRGSGTLPSLPWGQPTLTMGLQVRENTVPAIDIITDYPLTPASSQRIHYFEKNSLTSSVYAETLVPLVKKGWLPLVHSLDLQLTGRTEYFTVDAGTPYGRINYNSANPTWYYEPPTQNGLPFSARETYSSTHYTAGFKYQPVSDVIIRVSRSTAFLPPRPESFVRNPTLQWVYSTTHGVLNATYGGNPDLKPQTSENINAGIIWAPKKGVLDGLRLNVEYHRNDEINAIGSMTADALIASETLFPERVMRDPVTNAITQLDLSLMNLYKRESEGWDISVDYSRNTRLGRISGRVSETIVSHLKTQVASTLPLLDGAGHPNENGGTLKKKLHGSFSWDWRGWTAYWSTQYIPSYKQYGAAGGPFSLQYFNGGPYTALLLPQGGDTIGSQIYHDLTIGHTFSYSTSESASRLGRYRNMMLKGLTIQVGVRNLFDRVPPFDVNNSAGYYSGFGDIRLRTYWVTVKKAF